MLKAKFGEQIEVILHDFYYDDTPEIKHLVDKVIWEGIALPAVFIDDSPELKGYIDKTTVIDILKQQGLSENQ